MHSKFDHVRPNGEREQLKTQASLGRNVIYIITFVTLVFVNTINEVGSFADIPAYFEIIDRLYFDQADSWYSFEPLSQGRIYLLRHLSGDTTFAVSFEHYLLASVFFLGIVWLGHMAKPNWRGLAICLALYGPLLGLVTIRATPAYILIAAATFLAMKGRTSSLAVALIATLFHISAVFAILPIFLCVIQKRYSLVFITLRSPKKILLLGGFVLVILVSGLSTYLAEVASIIVSSIHAIEKYYVYVDQIAGNVTSFDQSDAVGTGVIHKIYAAVVLIFLLVCCLVPRTKLLQLHSYILISMLTFLFLRNSGAAAFRQSIFFMIPLVFLFPWERYFGGPAASLLLLVVCASLTFVNLSGVIID